MKILVYSKDEAVKEFCQSSKGRYGIYLNFLALKDYISNMDENLEPGDLVTLILDYDIEREREMIDDFNTEVSFLDNVFTAYISGETSLKELREHQTSDSSANAYLFKPLSTDAIEQAIEDFEAASTNIMPNPLLAEEVTESVAVEDHSSDDEDAATVIDLNFKNLDKASRDNVEDNEFDDDVLDLGTGDHDCTGVRQVVNSHNEEINLADSETNSKIQNLFDQAFDSDENDDLDLSGDLGDLSLSDSSGILEGIDPLNDDDDDNAEFSLDENAADLSLGDSDDALNLSEDTTEEDEELDDDAFSLDLGDISEINEEVSFVEQEDTKDVAVEAKIEVEAEADEGFEATADFKMEQYGLDAKESPEELYPQEEEEFVETVDPTTTMSQDTEGLNFSIPAPQVAKENEENKSEKAAEKVVSPADNYTIPRMNESEALRYQATIAQLREEREGLLQTINQQKQELAVTQQDGLGTRAELEEAKIEISIMKKRYMSEVEDMKYRLKIANDKKEYTEEKNKFMEKEFSRLEQRVRVDVNQIQQREKELEGQLELVKIDSESQVQTRDKKILDLKRKIDQLEFNMENSAIREQKSRDDKVHLEDRLDNIMRTLRGSIEVLEDDMNWTDKDKQKI